MPYFEIDISKWTEDARRLVGGKRIVDSSMGEISGVKTVRGFVQVTGIPQVLQNYKKVDKYLRGWGTRRTRMAAMEIAAQSQVEVPRDTGELGDSMFIIEAESDYGGAVRIDVGYDTDEVDYAWLQHENPEYNHPTPGTKMHYLSDPFEEVGARYPQELTLDLQKAVAKVDFVASPESGGISDNDYEDEGMGINDAWAARRAARDAGKK